MAQQIQFELNGKQVEVEVEKGQTLLWLLRTRLNLTGTKYGCGEWYCGSCTVLMNDNPVRSCGIPVQNIRGSKIVTIEGLEKDGELHPVQKAFAENDAFQCGFCTPGMIMSAVGLLNRNPDPTREDIINGMEGNLCRCGAHTRIIDAIESAAKKMKGVPTP